MNANTFDSISDVLGMVVGFGVFLYAFARAASAYTEEDRIGRALIWLCVLAVGLLLCLSVPLSNPRIPQRWLTQLAELL